MLSFVNLQEIQNLLLRVPALVRDLERREPGFASSVKEWLIECEQILVGNRLPIAAGVAALRGIVISAERGVSPPGLVFNQRLSLRKIKDAAAGDVLRRAEEVIAGAIAADAARFAEGEKLMRQVVAVAERKGLVLAEALPEPGSARLRTIWQGMTSDPELGPATTRLVGLVGGRDALVLLDRVLP